MKRIFNKNFISKIAQIDRKSFFVKNYVTYTFLIIVSFALTFGLFISQLSVYSLKEQTDALSVSANRARDLSEIIVAAEVTEQDELYNIYTVNMLQIAEESEATIIVSDTVGKVIFYYDPLNLDINKSSVSTYSINQVLKNGEYSEIGDLNGFFDNSTYVHSTVVTDTANSPVWVIFMGRSAESVTALLNTITNLFSWIMAFILMIVLVISYFVTRKITLPLESITTASKEFSNGNFSFRVIEDKNCSEIYDLSKNINEMAAALELSEEKRTTFIENVSHEIKTPMTSIGGFVDGILDGTIPADKQNHYLKIISTEVERLSRLTVRMLQTSRMQDDSFTIRKVPFNLSETISHVIISFEQKILDKQLEVHFDVDENVFVNADRDNIYQVIYNLLDNAVKFSTPYGVLELRLIVKNNKAKISISNENGDLKQEHIDHLFDRFYKTDYSRSEDKTGAGLGLFIVKKILILHDSNISVSAANELITFNFSLDIHNNHNK